MGWPISHAKWNEDCLARNKAPDQWKGGRIEATTEQEKRNRFKFHPSENLFCWKIELLTAKIVGLNEQPEDEIDLEQRNPQNRKQRKISNFISLWA